MPSLACSAFASGWNTWNTRSVLSHVLLPAGLSLNLGLKEYRDGGHLREVLIGRIGTDCESIRPGAHAMDGSYTELTLDWRDVQIRIQSAWSTEGWVLLATPLRNQLKPSALTVEIGFLWNRPGVVSRQQNSLEGRWDDGKITLYATAFHHHDPNIAACGPYWVLPLEETVGLSTGRYRDRAEITALLAESKARHDQRKAAFGSCAEIFDAIQTCLAWDTIYDPLHDRAISPVSRIWNVNHGGYVLFCWDTWFAAWMASLESRELAWANALAIADEATDAGFVPNFANANLKSLDRSQPPIGSLVTRELFRRFGDREPLEHLFPILLRWNQWWWAARRHGELLCWGSTPYTPTVGNRWETDGVNARLGAALESGLDDSPMYDEIPFDERHHLLKLADVGLMGLYGLDCEALADLARVLGKTQEAAGLTARAQAVRDALGGLWDEASAIYLNRRTDSGEHCTRLSPTNFYPLLCRAASTDQASLMMSRHLQNPAEFHGSWMLPSIARNDPAFPEQTYWRGRIWAPMNFLVYLGLRRYGPSRARDELVEKSAALLLKEWREHGHVHENYHAETGDGCDRENSDRFYHWGGLLGMPALMEAGYLAAFEKPLMNS